MLDRETFTLKSIRIHGGWFGNSYLMLMVVAPFVNAMIEKCVDANKLIRSEVLRGWLLIALWLFLLSSPLMLLLPTRHTGFGSCSFFTLLFMYVTARLASIVFTNKIKVKALAKYGLACALYIIIGAASLWGMRIVLRTDLRVGWFTDYYVPAVWGFALIVFMAFLWYVKIPGCVNKFLKFIGPSIFSIYLIHDTTHIGRLVFIQRVEECLNAHFTIHPVLVLMTTAVAAFLGCLSLDIVLRRPVAYIGKKLTTSIFNKIDSLWMKFLERHINVVGGAACIASVA